MPDDVSSRILAAATLAEQAVAKTSPQGDWQPYFTVHGDPMLVPVERPWPTSRIADIGTEPADYGRANCKLLGASGPSHWGAVAELLRIVEVTHDSYWRACSQGEHHCRHGYIACENLSALLPLADQIIRDLGDGQNG